MADEENSPSPFNVQTIRYLVSLMSRHDLSEIDLRQGEHRIRLRRGSREILVTPPPAAPAAAHAPAPAAPTAAAAAAEADKPSKPFVPIKSPTPGTFYTAPNPDTPAFVQVGTRVSPSTVVCLIEAMKIFNEITADCSGVITDILVENQQPVEFGQVLFKVDPSG